MTRDKYTLTSRSVPAQPRSKRRASSAAAGTGGGTAADIDLSGYLTVAEFRRYFTLVDMPNPLYQAPAEGEEAAEDAPGETLTAIKALYDGLCSDGFISALGAGGDGSVTPGTGGLDETRLAAWMDAHIADYLPTDHVKQSALADYYTKEQGDARYLRTTALNDYYNKTQSDARYLQPSALTPYITEETANSLYLRTTALNDYYNKTQSDARYLQPSALDDYYTKTQSDARYLQPSALDNYLTKGESDGRYVKKTGDTMTGNLTLPSLIATSSVKIGAATLTYDAAAGAVRVDKGFYSDSYVSAKGAGANGSTATGGASVNAVLWGNAFTGAETLDNNLLIGERGGLGMLLEVSANNNRGLWAYNSGNGVSGWMVGLSSAGQLQFSAGSEASFLMAVKSSSFFEGTRFVSKVATGTAPVTVASTTCCENLNADLLDGKHASELLTEVGAGRSARSLKITVGGNSIEYNTPFALRTDLGNYISSIQDGGTTGNVITDIRQDGGNLVITRGTVSGGSSAPAAHTHDAADITSGKLALARIPTGTTGSTVALGNHTHSGYALSNHTHSGYAAASHTHNYLPTTVSTTAGIALAGSVNNPCLWMYNSKFPLGASSMYGIQMLTNDGLFIGAYAKGGILIDGSGYVYACGPNLFPKTKLN